MPKSIEDLKSDHVKISDIFRQIVEVGITSEEGQKKLFHAKASLLAHLKMEDEEFYPILKKEAESNQDLKQKLESFARDMEAVTAQILAFFEKYSGVENEINFMDDFSNIYIALTIRINNEESKLFPEYEKLII